jgi:hypothetical protein
MVTHLKMCNKLTRLKMYNRVTCLKMCNKVTRLKMCNKITLLKCAIIKSGKQESTDWTLEGSIMPPDRRFLAENDGRNLG